MPLGLYAREYRSLKPRTRDSGQAEKISANDHRDIAGVKYEFIDVCCWPRTEVDGRKWGKLGEDHAAILPFRMKAHALGSWKVKNFKTVISVADADCDVRAVANDAGKDLDHDLKLWIEPSVYLRDSPYPSIVQQKEDSNPPQKLWKFEGRGLTHDYSGRMTAAEWTWTVKKYAPRELHGVMVICHPQDSAVKLSCRVEGTVHKFPRTYTFRSSNEHRRWWTVDPQPPDESLDIKKIMSGLETDLVKLNLSQLSRYSHEDYSDTCQFGGESSRLSRLSDSRAQTSSSTSGVLSTPSHNFETTQIGGSANVNMGTTINNTYYPMPSSHHAIPPIHEVLSPARHLPPPIQQTSNQISLQ